MQNVILSLRNITKKYPGVVALDRVSIDFLRGEVHALLGENGAGKSTLIKVLSGAVRNDEGEIIFEGKSFAHMTPQLSKSLGIEVIYQEYNLIRTLSVAENICLEGGRRGMVNFQEMREIARETLKLLGVDLNPNLLVRNLSPAYQQLVEIAKAISKNAKIIVMDEPTAQLSLAETERLYEVIGTLKKRGVTIIYITHRLDEVFAITDRVSVLRDGKHVATMLTKETDKGELISLMVGRELTDNYPKADSVEDVVLLRVQNISGGKVKDASFELKKGEILGIAGLVGAGRTELARLIYGADRKESGTIEIEGKKVDISSPADAIRCGIGFIPEERQSQGCFLRKDIAWNIAISNIKNLSKKGVVDERAVIQQAQRYRDLFAIKTPSLRQLVMNLSGGNQQKVVLARVLAVNPKIIIFDEPTRGIDVGARYEIYRLIAELARQGKGIIMISSDMQELLGMCDRILVMAEGKLVGEVMRGDFDQKRILQLASCS